MTLFKSWKGAAQTSDGDGDPEIEVSEDTLGRILQRAREDRGYDLQQVSQVLRIRYVYLDAIEKGRFDRLPGPAYATGFLRSYADFLDLDPDAVVEAYKRGSETAAPDSALYFPAPKADAQIPRGALFIVAALVAMVAYAGWYYLSEPRNEGIDLVPPLPDRLAALVGTEEDDAGDGLEGVAVELPESPSTALDKEQSPPAAAPVAEEGSGAEVLGVSEAPAIQGEPTSEDAEAPSEPATAPSGARASEEIAPTASDAEPLEMAIVDEGSVASQDSPILESLPRSPPEPEPLPELLPSQALPAEIESDIEDAETETASITQETAEQAGPVPGIPDIPDRADGQAGLVVSTPTVYGEENGSSRVTLQASQDSWVQVRNAEGELLLTRVLRPGDSYRVPDQEGLTLLTGNAGGLEVFVDGRKLPALGPIGAVRRNIDLRPDALLALSSGVE